VEANKFVRGNYGVKKPFFTETVIETVRPAPKREAHPERYGRWQGQ